jgi:riboflavin synthase
MFTGIIETVGEVKAINDQAGNKDLVIASAFSNELKVDQSVNHNGCCLTVVDVSDGTHTVTAIAETLTKSNLDGLAEGDAVNLERALAASGRFDGHIVQGHVDQVATCTFVEEENGSWRFGFEFDPSRGDLVVEKGSVCLNGVSLTVVDAAADSFAVAIIPFTYEHTTFKALQPGSEANLEFDIVGKYVAALQGAYRPAT